MSDQPDPERLRALEERLERLKGEKGRKPHVDDKVSAASDGWRMVIELVSGLAIGFSIGFGLDTLFGTMPFMMVLFTLLGFAAGVKVMLGTAREMQNRNAAAGSARDEGE